MAILDVWVAKPGNVCRVDDNAWTITIYDAHQNVFEWAGTTYADLPAPKAHWADKMPPGTYVVQGRRVDGSLSTDHAIVVVDCDTTACVHLYPAAPGEKPPGRCAISIDEVTGQSPPSAASQDTHRIRVSGTATDCPEVKLEVSCGNDTGTAVAVVAGDGSWWAIVNMRQGCRCGGPVHVVAICAKDPKCRTERTVEKLPCVKEDAQKSG